MNDRYLMFGTIISIEDDLSSHCNFPLASNGAEDAIREIFRKIELQKLGDWKLNLIIVYKRARNIYFGKRGISVPSEKTIEFFLRLAVPTLEQAPYGFNKKKFEYDDAPEKGFFKIAPNFEDYESLEAYFVDSALRAIEEVLKSGITVNGEKLKLPTNK